MSRSLYDKLYRRFGPTLPDSEVDARSRKLVDAEPTFASAAAPPAVCTDRFAHTKVAIVGGGFAGMMAAWWLCNRQKAINDVLFEAGAEVSGRVLSSTTFAEGRVIEFGAELVGANHPVWIGLARDL